MRLSDAIRLGAMIRRQGHGALFSSSSEGFYSCALGAAGEAGGLFTARDDGEEPDALAYVALRGRWPVLNRAVSGCAECDSFMYFPRTGGDVTQMITHLNDHHCWTRERIADYIAEHYEAAEMPELVAVAVGAEAR